MGGMPTARVESDVAGAEGGRRMKKDWAATARAVDKRERKRRIMRVVWPIVIVFFVLTWQWWLIWIALIYLGIGSYFVNR